MVMTLGEVLELDALRRAAPEVVVGADRLDRPVRWVHTSELAEAAYLLKGGELLLTTGLGITGRGAVGEAAYVAALAERGVAALALELGWTFPEAPRALVEACRRHALPLLVLREVVPFVEVTEQVQAAILDRAEGTLRRDRNLRQVLTDALLDGAGPAELTAVLADLLAAPVLVTTAEGALVAAAGTQAEATGRRGRPVARRDVVLLDRHWGQLAVLPPARADDPQVAAACTYGAEALGLALLRSAAGDDLEVRRRQLLDDLAERRWRAPGELVARARVLGLPFPADGRYAALLVTDLGTADPGVVTRAVTGALAPGSALAADVGEGVLAVVRTSAVTAAARAVLHGVDAAGAESVRVVAGPVVGRLEDVDRSIARARAAAELAAADERIVQAAGMTAPLLLTRVRAEPLAGQLVREQIGPLVDHDATTGSELVPTLRRYLAHGSSKVATAEAMRLRRQTLYARLQRIEALIGDVGAPGRHAALVLALALDELGVPG